MEESTRSKFWSFIAIGVVCLLVAPLIYLEARPFGEALVIFSGLSFLGAIIIRVGVIRPRYDLNRLREIHEREELRAIEGEEGFTYDSFVCMGCGETYNMNLPICPRCRIPQGTPPCG